MTRHTTVLILLTASLLLAGCTTSEDDTRDADDLRSGNNDDDGDSGPVATLTLDEPCPGHWHSQTLFLVNNSTLPLDHPDFLRGNFVHLHANTGGLLHFHPGRTPTCIPTEAAFAWLGMAVDDDAWTLDERHGTHAGNHSRNTTHRLHVELQPWNSTWQTTSYDAWADKQLPNGARLLVSYGALSESDLAWQREQVPPVPPQYTPND